MHKSNMIDWSMGEFEAVELGEWSRAGVRQVTNTLSRNSTDVCTESARIIADIVSAHALTNEKT